MTWNQTKNKLRDLREAKAESKGEKAVSLETVITTLGL
jgi:hypothetical protein